MVKPMALQFWHPAQKGTCKCTSVPQYQTLAATLASPPGTLDVKGLKIHFVHKRSSNPDAKPLVLSHGWPGSVWEFNRILPMLTEPQLHGGSQSCVHVL